jgi:DNA-binding transcriptional regulator YhcF (GntR family)
MRNNEQYKKYLQSKEWEIKADKCKKLANYQCKLCGSKKNLQAHHLTYKNIYNELQEDLLCVCSNCHKKLHPHMEQEKYLKSKKGWCKMYKKEMSEVLIDLTNNPLAQKVWVTLWDYMKKDGTIKMPMQKTLAQKLDTNQASISRAIKKLRYLEIIEKIDNEWRYNPFIITVANMNDTQLYEAQEIWEKEIGHYKN